MKARLKKRQKIATKIAWTQAHLVEFGENEIMSDADNQTVF